MSASRGVPGTGSHRQATTVSEGRHADGQPAHRESAQKACRFRDVPAPARVGAAGRVYGVATLAKDTEKLIRQLSLISYLMAERRPVTATEIRRDVEGYSDMTEDA